jgi:hypothetical protein
LQTPLDAAPKTQLEDGLTWIDNQFEEDLEPPLGQDRDNGEEGETELAGCRVTRTSTSSRCRKRAPDTGGGAFGGRAELDDLSDQLSAQANSDGRCIEAAAALAYSMPASLAERGC